MQLLCLASLSRNRRLRCEEQVVTPPGLTPLASVSDWHASLAFFDGIDYEEAASFRVITSPEVPVAVRVAVSDARSKVLLALAESARGSVPEQRLWKCITHLDRLLFAVRPGGRRVRRGGKKHASHKGQGWERALVHRVRLLHCGDWAGLYREALPFEPPERGLSLVKATVRQAQRVERLVAKGEVSKAVASVKRDAEPQPPSEDEFRKLSVLFPVLPPVNISERSRDSLLSDSDFPLARRESLEAAISKCILQAPKLSGPGPTDSRFEHWEVLRENPAGLRAAATVLARLILGELPAEAHKAHLAGRLVGIPKSCGGVRPLACGSVARRLATKGACLAFGEDLSAACGPCQYAVGRVGGAEKLHKTLTLLAELRPDALFIKLDMRNAYNSMLRSAILDAVALRAPQLLRLAATLCPPLTGHVWYDAEGRGRRVTAERGVDQGCPLSPPLFAIGLAPTLEQIRAELRAVDPQAHVLSFLDDVHLVISPSAISATMIKRGRVNFDNSDAVELALSRVRTLLQPLGLELRDDKQRVWSPHPQAHAVLPGCVQLEQNFTVLGASTLWVEDECARVDLAGEGSRLELSLAALMDFSRRLFSLREHGLPLSTALTLHRAWAGGTLTHHLRSNLVDEAFVERWDSTVTALWEKELGRPLGPSERVQIHLPTRLGGCGVSSASVARLPAFLGSWELCFAEVAQTLGANSASQLRDGARGCFNTIERAAAALRFAGVADYTFDWEELYNAPRQRRQHDLTKALQLVLYGNLLAELPVPDQVDLRSAGGKGAGAFLEPQVSANRMSDIHLRTALRRRLRLPHPGFDVSSNTSDPATHCNHRSADTGNSCGRALVEGIHDPTRCDVGGAKLHFHHQLRDFVADWTSLHTGAPTQTEQIVEAWCIFEAPSPEHPEGRTKLARLDVSATIGAQRTFIDVGFRTAATDDVEARRARAHTDGAAASHYVAEKRRRYPPKDNPGVALVPFIVEALGRPSLEAASFLRAVAPTDPAKRAGVLAAAWQSISVITQTRLAELLISAELPRPPH